MTALAKTMLPESSYSIVFPKSAWWLTAWPSGKLSTLMAASTSASVATLACLCWSVRGGVVVVSRGEVEQDEYKNVLNLSEASGRGGGS